MPQKIPKHVLTFIVLGYVLLVTAVVAAMFVARSSVLESMGTEESQQAWNEWRTEAAKQDGTQGPVQRSTPRSGEPPSMVLMRDYFAVSTIGLLLPVSALYGFIAWVVCGVAYQSPPEGQHESHRGVRR